MEASSNRGQPVCELAFGCSFTSFATLTGSERSGSRLVGALVHRRVADSSRRATPRNHALNTLRCARRVPRRRYGTGVPLGADGRGWSRARSSTRVRPTSASTSRCSTQPVRRSSIRSPTRRGDSSSRHLGREHIESSSSSLPRSHSPGRWIRSKRGTSSSAPTRSPSGDVEGPTPLPDPNPEVHGWRERYKLSPRICTSRRATVDGGAARPFRGPRTKATPREAHAPPVWEAASPRLGSSSTPPARREGRSWYAIAAARVLTSRRQS